MINTECWNCGERATEQHHVIPVSAGGTKTLPLCAACHGLAHRQTHRELIIQGVARAKAAGKRAHPPHGYLTAPDGSFVPDPKWDEKLERFISDVAEGRTSIRAGSVRLGVSPTTARTLWHRHKA